LPSAEKHVIEEDVFECGEDRRFVAGPNGGRFEKLTWLGSFGTAMAGRRGLKKRRSSPHSKGREVPVLAESGFSASIQNIDRPPKFSRTFTPLRFR